MGEIVSTIHSLDVSDTDLPVEDWGAFVDRQTQTCVDRQLHPLVPDLLIDQLPEFLSRNLNADCARQSLIHTELTYDCWFVVNDSGRWTVSGLLDFGDAMVGDVEADFFYTKDRELLRTYFQAGGYDCNDPGFRHRILANFLLHRYVGLGWMLKQAPAPSVRSLNALADYWFEV